MVALALGVAVMVAVVVVVAVAAVVAQYMEITKEVLIKLCPAVQGLSYSMQLLTFEIVQQESAAKYHYCVYVETTVEVGTDFLYGRVVVIK